MQGLTRDFEFAHMLRACCVQFRQVRFGGLEPGLSGSQGLREFFQFTLFSGQAARIRSRQLCLLLSESALTDVQLFELTLGVAKAVLVNLTCLFALRHNALRLAHALLRFA